MIRPIIEMPLNDGIKEPKLSIKAEPIIFNGKNHKEVVKIVKEIGQDLLDTAYSNERCLGLAANQIGHITRMFVFKFGDKFLLAINPEILEYRGGDFPSWESCLSRPGREPICTRRFKRLKVSFLDMDLNVVNMKLSSRVAVEFQHEFDHLEGKLI
ncbi:MAG: peptide deformylase [Candidatus Brocadiales bacterium]|nr:peptide deformylase [Candidatus Brocadiales bacterium]